MKLDLAAPHQEYRAADGRKLTGVTTYLGALNKPPLMPWYASMERDGILSILDELEASPRWNGGWTVRELRAMLPTKPDGKPLWFAEAKRDRAADLGTVTHARCEAWNKKDPLGLEPDGIPADLYEQSVHGFERYKAFMLENGLTVLSAEEQFVHEWVWNGAPMAYGGTRDVVCRDDMGLRVLVDLKTSKASPYWPYDETYAQVAAYAHPPNAEIERIVVVRIGTTPDDRIQTRWLTGTERRLGWKMFCGAYLSYEAKKALTRAKKDHVAGSKKESGR